MKWVIDRIVNFNFNSDFVKDGLAHFGFHVNKGKYYAVSHPRHFMGQVSESGQLEWTAAKTTVFPGVPNIQVPLNFPIFVDRFSDGSLVVSNFGDNHLYRIYSDTMKAELLVDGNAHGIRRAGNCVVDADDCIWLNEVEGCRIRKFDQSGRLVLTLGTGEPGFDPGVLELDDAKFNWIYDIRKGPDGNLYVLDSKNFAVRLVDLRASKVSTVAGTGKPGYSGDGGDPMDATFGSNPGDRFDGPISMSLDESGNIYVGDRFNGVVRMIERRSKIILTIAGDGRPKAGKRNDPRTRDPTELSLPKISSMDFSDGRLYVPTDLTDDEGDLAVLRRAS